MKNFVKVFSFAAVLCFVSTLVFAADPANPVVQGHSVQAHRVPDSNPAAAPASPAVTSMTPVNDQQAPAQAELTGPGVDLIKKVAKAYADINTYQDESTVHINMAATGSEQKFENKFSFNIKQPNKLALILKSGVMAVTIVADGKKIWTCVPQLKQYTQADSPSTIKEVINSSLLAKSGLAAGGMLIISIFRDDPVKALLEDVKKIDITGEEDLDGVKVKHVIQQIKQDEMDLTMDMWVDSSNYLIRKLRMDLTALFSKRQNVPPDLKMVIEETHQQISVNKPIDDSAFVFTAPAGYRQVDKLQAGGAEQTAEPEKAAEPNAAESTGKPAPDFKTGILSGGNFSLADCKNKVVVIDFWATWCGPCRRELPVYQKIVDAYKNKDVVFIAVNAHEDNEKVSKFISDSHYTFQVGLDSDSKIEGLYQVDGYPTMVIIDKQGFIQKVHLGLIPNLEDQLKTELDALLK